MRWVVMALAALVAACSTSGSSRETVADNYVGYDVKKDADADGQYIASAAYVEGQGVNVGQVRWRSLLNGVQQARKDGFDLVRWGGPAAARLTQTTRYNFNNMRTTDRAAQYSTLTYVVRGYHSNAVHPLDARPIPTVIDQINGEIAKAGKN